MQLAGCIWFHICCLCFTVGNWESVLYSLTIAVFCAFTMRAMIFCHVVIPVACSLMFTVHFTDVLIGSYKELHDWSANNYAEFWEECFLFFDILHSAPYSQVQAFKL